MKFSYTALTRDNKKISGVLDAENKDTAQAELHKMGVAIVSITEISEEEYERLKKEREAVKVEKGIRTFNFEGIDPNGKEVEGTIDALDEYSAYRRLRIEYQFKVKNLYPVGAAEAEKEATKAALEGFEPRVQEEMAAREIEEEEIEEEEAGINKEVVAEVDKVIINTKKTLEEHGDLFSMDLLAEIQNTLGELERIRTSNNIKHITEVSNNLYALISNPDKTEEGKEVEDKTYKQLIGEIRDSALVRKEFELYKKAVKVTGLKKIFENIFKRLQEITAPKEKEAGKPPGFFGKLKLKIHAFLEKATKKKPPKIAIVKKPKKPKTRFGEFLEKFGAYMKAKSPVLKRTRQRELMKAFKALFGKKKAPKKATEEAAKPPEKEVKAKKIKPKVKKKRDFTRLFVEIDSFIGWLLCFYIIYFFLVNFSLEKNIGIKQEFVFKTLKTPLLLNITIFLLIIHFTLRIRNLHFQKNALATFFLIALSLGIYTLLIVNF